MRGTGRVGACSDRRKGTIIREITYAFISVRPGFSLRVQQAHSADTKSRLPKADTKIPFIRRGRSVCRDVRSAVSRGEASTPARRVRARGILYIQRGRTRAVEYGYGYGYIIGPSPVPPISAQFIPG